MNRQSANAWMWVAVAVLIMSACGGPVQSTPPVTETAAAGAARTEASTTPKPAKLKTGRTVVVWISIDGMRGDYVERTKTPFFHRLMKEGAFTRQLAPIFPSLTFPSHVAQVTGASVNRHGIIANAIYDERNDRRWSYPNVASEILCEPIWTTVKRGGARVLVYDWPVSQQQTGQYKADYFDQSFDGAMSDQQRMDRLIETWSKDRQDSPLQLIMGYVSAVDKAGHKYGPSAAETLQAVEETDRLLGKFFKQAKSVFEKQMTSEDTFCFLLTTDHGMDDVKVILNLQLMCGSAWNDEMRLVASGSVGNIFLKRLGPPPARKPYAEKLLEVLKTYPFAHAYTRDKLPKAWQYDHRSRTGDVVVSLDAGYMFSEREGPAMKTIDPADGPLGMHGYPSADNPGMLGFSAIWRSGKPLGGTDLGAVDSRRLHATVAKWLKVAPAETAVPEAIDLP